MRILAGLLILIVAACDSPSEPDSRWAIPENITYAPSLEIDLAAMNMTESGLYWQDIEIRTEGSPVVLDDVIRFHYTIWLPDGSMVETTRGSTPLQRAVLLLIPGLAEGITGMGASGAPQGMPAMHAGGVRKLVIRPELAWPNGRGPIPPRTTLIYEVEVTAIVRD
jgi:FKBP-type peptidyl-prolyl cis-trans isomerase FkpA